jgi:hypothetical protein
MAAAEKKDGSGSGLSIAIVATVLVAFAGILVGQWQLVGTRPAPTEIAGYPPGTLQDVPGRLWQDPFAAIDQYLKRPKDASADQDPASQRSGRDRLGEVMAELGKSGAITDIVGVMVFGGDYPEYAEQRRRTRYAVVSALSTASFVPEQPEGLGFIMPSAGLERQRRVPFEWFRQEGSGRRVLLLWVDENSLDEHRAVSQLTDFTRQLAVLSRRSGGRVLILGPIASATLQGMTAEMAAGKTTPPDMTFFSTATASSAGGSAGAQPDSVLRVIATDRAVMGALVPELRRRGIDPTRRERPDRIILLSEWDTSYGRELPRALETAICGSGAPCVGTPPRPPWVRRFSYLRGLDGQIPGAARPASRRDSEKTPPDSSGPFEPLERAEGTAQVDYLRRLASHVRELAPDPADRGAPGDIKAIGVLGSDVYDKSLVLRAFRREFPKAVFFTTDLDARMLHPAEYAWTRNLVVASSFGFMLDPNLQRHIPPFRDTYQTAMFFATQCALEAPGTGCTKSPRVSQAALSAQIPPRVFEIGRGLAFDLSGDLPRGIHPEVPRVLPNPNGRHLAIGLGIVLSGSLLLYLVSPPLKEGIDGIIRRARGAPRRRKAWAAAGLLVAAGLVMVAGVGVVLENQTGEPFLAFSGISLWPTEMLRFIAAALSVCFLVAVRRVIRRVRLQLDEEFGKIAVPEPRGSGLRAWLKGVWPALRDRRQTTGLLDGKRYKAEALWGRYLEQSSFRSQCQRVIPAALLFLIFCGLILSFDPLVVPTRGLSVRWIDHVLLWLSAPLLVWLILVVSDTIRLGDKYAKFLGASEPTKWPDHMLEEAGKRLGITLGGDTPDAAIKEACISHWLDIKVIEMWTDIVSPIIYYPFIVLCLMILSRSPLFDNLGTPYQLMVVFGVSGLYAAACAFKLRGVAERARGMALERFTHLLVRAKGQGGAPSIASQIEIMTREIESLRRGAFAPLTEQPVVRALLLPISSAGGLTVFRYLGWGG